MEKKLQIFIFLLVLALSIRLFIFYRSKTALKDGESLSFQTSISSQPKQYSTDQTFTVETGKGERILIKTKPDKFYQYGDNLSISGNLKLKVIKNNALLSMEYPTISVFTSNKLAVFNLIRQKISDTYQNNLSQDDASLLEGIVFGIKGNMSQEFLNQLKIAGVMHVIAASGMNVTITAGFIFYIASFFIKRQVATIVTIFALLLYAFLAGLQASIIRASIMAIIAFSAQAVGKQAYSLYGLMLTAFIMLFLWPKYLLDIGFQLSFLATLGILIIPSLFSQWKTLLSSDFLTTVSAQLATLPIIASSFGVYSIWSVVVNLLVLWTIPIVMVLGSLAAIFSFFEPLSKVILLFTLPLLWYFEQIVRFFSGLGGVITFQNISWQFVVSYYFLLAAIIVLRVKISQKR